MQIKFLRFLFMINILLIAIERYLSIIVANSKLEICANSSKPNNVNFSLSVNQTEKLETFSLECKEKITVSLAIDNSQYGDSNYLEAYIYEVDSKETNNNNNFVGNDKNNSKKKLQNPIRINIRKSSVYIEYPSIYAQTFNYKPSEQVIISNIFSCEDGDLAQKPTCGWTLNSLSQKIPFSQGFCCKCDFAQIIGINNTDRNRGNTCRFLNLSNGSATAHCLKYDPLWWSAYEINNYNIVYQIEITVTYMDNENKNELRIKNKLNPKNKIIEKTFEDNSKNNLRDDSNTNNNINNQANMEKDLGNNNNNSSKFIIENEIYEKKSNETKRIITKKLFLSPNNRISSSEDNKVISRLIGDFLPSTEIRSFSNYYLLIPSYPSNHPMVIQGPLNWLLIPKEYFSLDGRECNKIGVSYSAFRNQQNRCLMRIGDCLNNQISDLFNSDLNRLSKGKPSNFILSESKLMNDAEVNFYSFSSESKKFAFKLNGNFNSLITLEIAADELRYVINLILAKIDFVKIKVFENNSRNGLLDMQMTNIGKIIADVFISFHCSAFILPLNGEKVSLNSFESKKITKNIFTTNTENDFNLNFNRTLIHNCTVKLSDFNGNHLDEQCIFFNTTKIEEINIQYPNNSSSTNNDKEKEYDNSKLENNELINLECKILCPEFFSYLCFIVHGCWGYFIRTTLILLVTLALVILLIRAIKNGSCMKILEKINICNYSNKENVHGKPIKYVNNINNNKDIDNDCNYGDFARNKTDSKHLKNPDFQIENIIEETKFNKTKSRMFLNFSNINFDFSHVNIFHNFSIEIDLILNIKNKKRNIDNNRSIITKIIFLNKNFITFCINNEMHLVLDLNFLKNKINCIPNFLTKLPLFSTFNFQM